MIIKLKNSKNFKSKIIKAVISLSFVFLCSVNNAQNIKFANGTGGLSDDIGYDIAIDSKGNIYDVGFFKETVDFDHSSNSFNLTSVANSSDIYIRKSDSNGVFLWAKQIGGNGRDEARSLVIDDNDNIYVVGLFENTINFSTDTSVRTFTSRGNEDAFIIKLDSLGEISWARTYGGLLYDAANNICLDANNNIYLTGAARDSVYFNSGNASHNISNTAGNNANSLNIKLKSNGNFAWARQLKSNSSCGGYSIVYNNNGLIYSTGYFWDTINLNSDTNDTLYFYSNGNRDYYVQAIDTNGVFIWAKSFGGSERDQSADIKSNSSGEVYITGFFKTTVDFDPSSTVYNLTSNGGDDVFIQKLDALGNLIWVKQIGGSDSDKGRSIYLDNNQNIYISGQYYNIVDFDPGAGTYSIFTNGNSDGFIVKLNANGNFEFAKSAGSINSDSFIGLVLDKSQNILTTGYFSETLDFETIDNAPSLVNKGQRDIVMIKYNLSQSISGIENLKNNTVTFLYPNPANNIINLKSDNNVSSIAIYNVDGEIIHFSNNLNKNSVKINISEYSNGVYFVKSISYGKSYVMSFIKNM